jgi:hypothetical protein
MTQTQPLNQSSQQVKKMRNCSHHNTEHKRNRKGQRNLVVERLQPWVRGNQTKSIPLEATARLSALSTWRTNREHFSSFRLTIQIRGTATDAENRTEKAHNRKKLKEMKGTMRRKVEHN